MAYAAYHMDCKASRHDWNVEDIYTYSTVDEILRAQLIMTVSLIVLVYLISLVSGSGAPSYAPFDVACPEGSLVREANSVSDHEQQWLSQRHIKTDQAMKDFLKYSTNFTDSEIEASLGNLSINLALAPSGGALRSLLVGAGEIAALDNTTVGAFEHGLGGLLQASSYLAGSSGSGWLVSSLIYNDMAYGSQWDFDHPFFSLGGLNLKKTINTWHLVSDEVDAKKAAGFPTSFTDTYGRALVRQLLNSSDLYSTLSSFRERPIFANHDLPFPLILAEGQPGIVTVNYSQSTVFEMNPYEFGTWDKSGNAFIDTKYLGSGQGKCVQNYDNAGFIIGVTASSLDSIMYTITLKTAKIPILGKLISKLFSSTQEKKNHVGIVDANPFFNTTWGSSPNLTGSKQLYLTDGGEDLQGLPFVPLIQKNKRNVDAIFAFDNTAGGPHGWPDGSTLTRIYKRQFFDFAKDKISFPKIPTESLSGNNTQPFFLGCNDPSNSLVIYVPNREYSYASNPSTLKFSYSKKSQNKLIQNGFEIVSRNNLTDDASWRTCVGCAVVKRSQERNGVDQSEQCKKCFSQYCKAN